MHLQSLPKRCWSLTVMLSSCAPKLLHWSPALAVFVSITLAPFPVNGVIGELSYNELTRWPIWHSQIQADCHSTYSTCLCGLEECWRDSYAFDCIYTNTFFCTFSFHKASCSPGQSALVWLAAILSISCEPPQRCKAEGVLETPGISLPTTPVIFLCSTDTMSALIHLYVMGVVDVIYKVLRAWTASRTRASSYHTLHGRGNSRGRTVVSLAVCNSLWWYSVVNQSALWRPFWSSVDYASNYSTSPFMDSLCSQQDIHAQRPSQRLSLANCLQLMWV